MGNPLWVSGGKSPNPEGARRHSIRTPKGMITAFLKRKIPPKKLEKLYDKLTANEQAKFILDLLPYTMGKAQSNSLTEAEISELYNKLETALKNEQAKKAG